MKNFLKQHYRKILVIALLSLVFFQPFFSAQNFSPVADEVTHLPSGYTYWKTGQIELNPQHPPLVKLFAAFPLLFMKLNYDPQDPALIGPFQNEWEFGQRFLFSNEADRLLFWGRIFTMLLSVLLGFYVFKWSSEWFGFNGGVLTLFLYAFMPNLIAHAQWVTTDLAVTAFSFITLYYLWRFVKTEKKRNLIFIGLALGLALGSKFSAVLLAPIILILLGWYVWQKKAKFHQKIRLLFDCVWPIFVIGAAVVYLIYFCPPNSSFYLKGLQSVYADRDFSHYFYLNGQFSKDGWWYYFLFAFLIKTPIPALLAFAAAFWAGRKYRLTALEKGLAIVPAVLFAVVTSWKALNMGIRYFLPVYPFLILYAGGLADWGIFKNGRYRRWFLAVGGLLAVWYVFSALAIYPDYLAYFNELVGGSRQGQWYLDDSNVEWKQGLKELADYQKKYPDTKVLFGWGYSNLEFKYYGLKNIIPQNTIKWWENPSGRYAIATHFLIRLQQAAKINKIPEMDWLNSFQPVDRIGYSFFVYEFK